MCNQSFPSDVDGGISIPSTSVKMNLTCHRIHRKTRERFASQGDTHSCFWSLKVTTLGQAWK